MSEERKRFDSETTRRITETFNRDGFALIPNVLPSPEVQSLKHAVDRMFADREKWKATDNIYGEYVGVRLFEMNPVFEDIITREPIISLVEHILGEDFHLIAENVVRNAPGQALDNFHVDDLVIFPLPDILPRHDPRMTMPVHILTVQVLLTDVPGVKYGPTEYVPGSHYAGRAPDDPKHPTFEGRGPAPVLGSAGDIYLHNGQCWHRGAPNTSDRTRCLLQLAYGRRWISQRFYPFVSYRMPERVLRRADARRRRVLGFHEKGAYG